MDRFSGASVTFQHAIERARQMVKLYDALSALRQGDPANNDALRSACIQAVSSFDFFAHELAVLEAKHRFKFSLKTRNISIPMEIMVIKDTDKRLEEVEIHIRRSNSYKAFVSPDNLSKMLSCYCDKPWDKICDRLNTEKKGSELYSTDQIKKQLESIWKRRNLIAHEADVNPDLAGIGLWPIYKEDVEITITFISEIGLQIPHVISQGLPEDSDLVDFFS